MISITSLSKPGSNPIKRKKTEPSVVSSLEFPLKLLRLFGLFPFSFKQNEDGELKLNFRWLSISTLWVFLLSLLFALGEYYGGPTVRGNIENFRIEHDTLKTIKHLCSAFHSFTIYFYLIYFKMRYFCLEEIVSEFDELAQNLKLTKPDTMFKKISMRISIFMLIFCVTENALYIYTLGTTNMGVVGAYSPLQYDTDPDRSIIQNLLTHFHFDFKPYTLNISILFVKIFQQAARSYAWCFVDVLMVLLFRLVSFRFKALAENALEIWEGFPNKKGGTPEVWEEVRCDYEELHGLLKKLNAFLSLPLLLSYSVNIILMAMHLSQWISSNGNDEHGVPIYASMSSFLLILRTIMVTHYGSEIHENAHLILTAVEKCSSSVYSISMERLERKLATQRIGLNAGGVVFISRSFFASIASVIFSIEIFLLQASQPSSVESQQ